MVVDLQCGKALRKIDLMGFEWCGFSSGLRWIKELSDQLGTSTRAFCKGAHHLLKLMDENLGVNLSYPNVYTISLLYQELSCHT